MLKKIYHGLINIIEQPVWGKGSPFNDYGRAFYTTEEQDLAREWSVEMDRCGYVNTYEIDLSEFYHMFLCSPISARFEYGDSSTIAGKSGIELAYMIMADNNIDVGEPRQIYSLDRTPEIRQVFQLELFSNMNSGRRTLAMQKRRQ